MLKMILIQLTVVVREVDLQVGGHGSDTSYRLHLFQC
jgi:hypothetical protein